MALRVLIVDDSGFFRRRLSEIISADPRLSVVGTAENGVIAIEQAKLLKPDVITMDIEMPVMDGITAVRHIMKQCPTSIVMLSTLSTAGAKATLDALEAGAADYMPKRFEDISTDRGLAHQRLCQRLVQLATNFRHSGQIQKTTQHHTAAPVSKEHKRLPIKLVAIGTSTGGPLALQKILTALPADFPYPILLIQHMPATFTPSFAERLNTQCAIEVKQAVTGDILKPGIAYLAPGAQQMLLKGNNSQQHIRIEKGSGEEAYQPCIDTTFESIAKVCPSETLAIILTGMGADGCKGCKTLKQLGASIWAQDKDSSTIYGMPQAVAKANLADKILNLSDIGKNLTGFKA